MFKGIPLSTTIEQINLPGTQQILHGKALQELKIGPKQHALFPLIPLEAPSMLLWQEGGMQNNMSRFFQILEFDPDNLDWIERSETLPHGIAHSYATIISDEQAGC